MTQDHPQLEVRRSDFFISYAQADQRWAEWIAAQLEKAGFDVVLDVWSWPAGSNFLARMDESLQSTARILIVLSEACLDPGSFVAEERWAALVGAKRHGQGILPVRVADCKIPPLLSFLIFVDLVGCDEEAASERLLAAALGTTDVDRAEKSVEYPGLRVPRTEPAYPQRELAPKRPGTEVTTISNLPSRNPNFIGRDGLLEHLYDKLTAAGGRPLALYGTGGAGKTQLAAEYAYRHAREYQIIWWLVADQPTLVAEQIASLATSVGLSMKDPLPEVAAAILDLLSHRTRWLLIFDGARQPGDIAPYLVSGTGHVLITSQQRGWGAIADQVEVGVFSRAESIKLLRRRLGVTEPLASEIAEELGDLPLAIEQVAAYLDATGTPPAEYLQAFRAKAGPLLDGEALGYSQTVETVWSLSLDRIEAESEPALRLLEVISYFASESVPLNLFTSQSELLRGSLRAAAADPFEFLRVVGTVVHYSLGQRHAGGLEVHRLLQAAIRHQLAEDRADEVAGIARNLLVQACPPSDGPDTWTQWAELTPHLLAAPAIAYQDVDDAARRVLLDAGRYLYIRGDYRAARDLSADLRNHWARSLGRDHPDVLTAGKNLASPLVGLGDYRRAEDLHRDVYERRQQVLGTSSLVTLNSASDLADTLRLEGKFQEAHDLNVSIRQRFLLEVGRRHPYALRCANNLANDLYGLELYSHARELDEQTFNLRSEVLGSKHPDTLASASNLATDLYSVGDLDGARNLLQLTYNSFLDVLGPNHPDVLATANNLAVALYSCGQHQVARKRHQETRRRFKRVLGENHPYVGFLADDLQDWPEGKTIRI